LWNQSRFVRVFQDEVDAFSSRRFCRGSMSRQKEVGDGQYQGGETNGIEQASDGDENYALVDS